MNVTKYEHSCLVIEDNGKVLVLDPGVLAKLPEIKNVEAVFVSHIHGDHLDIENLSSLIRNNKSLKLIGSEEVVNKLSSFEQEKIGVSAGDKVNIGQFELLIGGDDHAVIDQKPPCTNRSLVINSKFYFPGDSFALPPVKTDLVAVPLSAPWLKSSDYMEFIRKIKAGKVIPIHNGLLSEFGEKTMLNWMSTATEEVNTQLIVLGIGETVEV